MLTRTKVFSLIVAALLVLILVPGAPTTAALAPAPDRAQVMAALQSAPVMFIENVGQFDDGTRFQVRGGNGTLWLAEDGLWVTVLEQPGKETRGQGDGETLSGSHHHLVSPSLQRGVNIKLSFVGANPHPRLEPYNRLDTHVPYFIGNDPANWHSGMPVWGGVRYVDLYPGVDLEVTSEGGRWAWQFAIRNSQFAIRNFQRAPARGGR